MPGNPKKIDIDGAVAVIPMVPVPLPDDGIMVSVNVSAKKVANRYAGIVPATAVQCWY